MNIEYYINDVNLLECSEKEFTIYHNDISFYDMFEYMFEYFDFNKYDNTISYMITYYTNYNSYELIAVNKKIMDFYYCSDIDNKPNSSIFLDKKIILRDKKISKILL